MEGNFQNDYYIMFCIYIVAFLVIVVIYYFNKFIKLKNKIKQSKSSIDIYLNKRFDLIPNLVECVKGYMNYEEKILTELVSLRVNYNNSKDLKLGTEVNNKMLNIFADAEANPNLKASEQFLELQKSLIKVESELQAARRLYNGDITLFNSSIQSFPGNLFAKILGYEEMDLFEVEEYKKENIKINL